jgi:hypothetical protein
LSREIIYFYCVILKGYAFIALIYNGVEIVRFFFHLYVEMKSYATSSQNRCARCLASYHMQRY